MNDRSTADVLDYAAPGRTPVASRPRRPIVRIVIFGLLLLPLIVLGAYPAAAVLPWGWEAHVYTSVPAPGPGRFGLSAFEVYASGTGRGRSARITGAYVTRFADPGGPGPMWVDLESMTYRRSPFVPNAPLTHEAMLDFLSAANLNIATGEKDAVADTMLNKLRKLSAGQVPGLRYEMAGWRVLPVPYFGPVLWLPWYIPWCVPLWLVAWWFLGRVMLRRHRRRLSHFSEARQAASEPAATA